MRSGAAPAAGKLFCVLPTPPSPLLRPQLQASVGLQHPGGGGVMLTETGCGGCCCRRTPAAARSWAPAALGREGARGAASVRRWSGEKTWTWRNGEAIQSRDAVKVGGWRGWQSDVMGRERRGDWERTAANRSLPPVAFSVALPCCPSGACGIQIWTWQWCGCVMCV